MSVNLVTIFYWSTLVLFICGIGQTLGLEKQDDGSEKIGLSLSEKEMNRTEIALQDPLKSRLVGTFKKTQKVKKRPGVSAIDYVTNGSIEPYKEDWSSGNVTESSLISLNISRSSNNSSLLKSYKSDEWNVSTSFDNVKIKDLILSGNLFSNSTFAPITKVESEESSSAESSARSSIKGNFELKDNLNGSKFVPENDASKISEKISNEDASRSNASLIKNEKMFSGDLNLYKTNLSNNDTVENSKALSHKPKSVLHKDNATVSFTSNETFSFSLKTFKIMSKPSTATMGEIGKMSSGNVFLISSIIGIVCLCALIGIIAYKRMYAYWYRRHYSRVDFLIDGLYEM